MHTEAARLSAHVQAHSDVAVSYAFAIKSVAGSAYGVELRTLAAAHHAFAGRLGHRLQELGRQPRIVAGTGGAAVAALARGPISGAPEVLRGKTVLIGDLADTVETQPITDETRRVVGAVLLHMRAHTHRVERFQAMLQQSCRHQ
jgi:hypothetical protein